MVSRTWRLLGDNSRARLQNLTAMSIWKLSMYSSTWEGGGVRKGEGGGGVEGEGGGGGGGGRGREGRGGRNFKGREA